MARGRPPKVKVKDLIADVEPYIAVADPPILAEFAHLHGITRQYLYELAEKEKKTGKRNLSDAIKKISEAKEIKLEQKALSGDYNSTMAVFSLKQLGWRDKPPEASKEEGTGITIINDAGSSDI